MTRVCDDTACSAAAMPDECVCYRCVCDSCRTGESCALLLHHTGRHSNEAPVDEAAAACRRLGSAKDER